MARKIKSTKRNEDSYPKKRKRSDDDYYTVRKPKEIKEIREIREDFGEGVFEPFKEIVPVKTMPSFDIFGSFKNSAQRLAFSVYEQNDIIFLLGPAGTGKSYLACMFAINELVKETKKRIVLTRPIVSAGEDLGYLPGTFENKTDPYMMPLYDCIRKMVPSTSMLADHIQKNTEVAPLAYMRGRTFSESVCILDEAQNCTWEHFLLFLTRLGEGSKMIVTGDPTQSDIGKNSALMDVVYRLEGIESIGQVKFTDEHIVRHKLVGQIIKRLQKNT
jgi:phosphate starvation-inducible PhoH-like protein